MSSRGQDFIGDGGFDTALEALCARGEPCGDPVEVARLAWDLGRASRRRLTVLPHRQTEALHRELLDGQHTTWLRVVHELEVYWTLLLRPGLGLAAERGDLCRLRSLTLLPHQEYQGPRDAQFFQNLEVVLRRLPRLERFVVIDVSWLPDFASALGQAITQLTCDALTVEVDHAGLDSDALEHLTRALGRPNVRSLVLKRGRLEGRAAGAALSARGLANLGSLRLEEGLLSAAALADWRVSQPALHEFELRHVHWSGEKLSDVVETGALDGLKRLVFDHIDATDDDVRCVAGLAARSSISEISLRGNELWDPDAVRELFDAAEDRLRRLDLAQNTYDDSLAVDVLEPRNAHGLRDLDLSENYITDAGAEALTGAPILAGVRRLSLSGNLMSDEGFEAMLGSGNLSEPAKVALWIETQDEQRTAWLGSLSDDERLRVDIELEQLSSLANAPEVVRHRLRNVTQLRLRLPRESSQIAAESLRPIAWFTKLAELELDSIIVPTHALRRALESVPETCNSLAMRHAQLNDDCLSDFVHLNRFWRLDLSHNYIRMARPFASLIVLRPWLQELSLAWNHLERDSLELINEVGHLSPWLRRLDVSWNPVVWPPDVVAPRLESLNLSGTETSLADLAKNCEIPSLRRLNIGRSRLSDDAAAAFLVRSPFPNLTHLGLNSTGLNRTVLMAMLCHRWPTRLSSFDLSTNSLSDDDLDLLVASEQGKRITRLDLACNSLTDATLERLAHTERAAPWEWLRIEGNPVTPDGIERLMRSSQITEACRAVLAEQLSIVA